MFPADFASAIPTQLGNTPYACDMAFRRWHDAAHCSLGMVVNSSTPPPGPKRLHRLDLAVPPVLVAVLLVLFGWLAAALLPAANFNLRWGVAAAAGIAVAVLCIAAGGVIAFRRARTTVNPIKVGTSTALVVTGVYRFTRNPMYLGFLLFLLSAALLLGNAVAFLMLPAFVAYMNRFQIAPEEAALKSLFGADYEAYQSRTRRWV